MSFLSLIVDCNPCNWGAFLEQENNTETFQHILSAIISFCNTHLVSSINNRLLLLAGGVKNHKKKLFSSTNCTDMGNAIHKIQTSLRNILSQLANDSEDVSSFSSYAAAISLSICAFQRYKREITNEPMGRIVIINLAKDLAAEQNMLMNLFFSANQQSLEVNVASLGNTPVPILQQACDITSGTHMLITKPHILAQCLMQNCVSISTECKDVFVSNHEEDVDYRAACHCHGQLVNIGWICSVCLSVHCQFLPICTTCNVLFSLSSNQKPARKKRNNGITTSVGNNVA